ncbi:sarcoplasmic/endoplasmic reticulum calcium ATPase regulator DWORF [Strigops habroptila]|uniref:sarcoplasmic/endoplasmic reticulum calcium ATPase regulator DWORF n=1 Tax=Strigops habroptila TaxID=2489341 RepID=UPI0011CEFC7F|nr:sarcoplasmic/endoplasmic reticulum calcium ATPase regulator DWORF [Strigops habroptila]
MSNLVSRSCRFSSRSEVAVRYNSSKDDAISKAMVREEAILKKAHVPLSHLVVPILLAVGWIVGCALMVYIVFS